MGIEALIKDTFERDAEHYRAGTVSFPGDVPVSGSSEKLGKKWRCLLVISVVMVVFVSVFSIKTGVFESSWAMPWAGMVELPLESPMEAFLMFLQKINSST